MIHRPLDPNDAPEGCYAAPERVDVPGCCDGCTFWSDTEPYCTFDEVRRPCHENRADGHSVIFKRLPVPSPDAALLTEAVGILRIVTDAFEGMNGPRFTFHCPAIDASRAFLTRYDAR